MHAAVIAASASVTFQRAQYFEATRPCLPAYSLVELISPSLAAEVCLASVALPGLSPLRLF